MNSSLIPVQVRLKAIKNIGKITKSMKMIAATKMNRAQKAMEVGRTFGQSVQVTLSIIDPKKDRKTDLEQTGPLFANEPNKRHLVLACSSDRGLCGAIHSSVSKVARRIAREAATLGTTSIAVLGDKAKPQIARDARRSIQLSFNQLGKAQPTFLDALNIVQRVQQLQDKTNGPFDRISIIYNRFASIIAYETSLVGVPTSIAELKESPQMAAYEVGGESGDDEILEHYLQWCLVSRLYWALAEGHAAEMSAKRTAMENATKNSEEMVSALTMKYNRTRQAVITNELVDIIVGASAL